MMNFLKLIFLLSVVWVSGQDIKGIQLFNPQTNDETPVIYFGEQLILRFDDLENRSQTYRYTFRHLDRNWQDDGLFFTEYATGSLNGIIQDMQYSFNTLQKYTHYTLRFPNEKMQPKISGNFELIVYQDTAEKPLFTKRFCVVENGVNIGMNVSRYLNNKNPQLNQRVEVQATAVAADLTSNLRTLSLNVIQNNNFDSGVYGQRASSVLGNQMLFQQLDLTFQGNNEFYYFDNKIINQAFDMVMNADVFDNQNYTYLYPVWAFPMNYQYQPDVNGAYFFRSNFMGRERDANRESDYSWVVFSLESEEVKDEDIFVLGQFNNYQPSEENQMFYDAQHKRYIAKIYLKQGFYNYILATKNTQGYLNFGEINGNFWQTENLYQAFLYYTPFGKNYDGLMGYGELRNKR